MPHRFGKSPFPGTSKDLILLGSCTDGFCASILTPCLQEQENIELAKLYQIPFPNAREGRTIFTEMEGSTVNEQQRDEQLNIRTAKSQAGFPDSLHHNRYEPTPYALLDILFNEYRLAPEDRLIDFGCGKGRLNFYVHHRFGAESAGVEMDKAFYEEALENRANYEKKHKHAKGKIDFCCCLAQDYNIQPKDNRFYFFNPFSVQIFMSTVNNILKSVEGEPRAVELILFFPSEDYVDYLEHWTLFEQAAEIPLPGIERDFRERFLIYRLSQGGLERALNGV